MKSRPTIGWREWVALPALAIPRIKVKVDTGARSSALHAFDIERFRRRGAEWVRFGVHPAQREKRPTVVCEAPLVADRPVRSSTGHRQLRPVILTDVVLGEARWPIEVTLTSRDDMGFRMLLGRSAVRGRFLIDCGRSFLQSRGPRRRR